MGFKQAFFGYAAGVLTLAAVVSGSAQAQTIERVSVSSAGDEHNGNLTISASVSGDGRLVAFSSDATNLVPDDSNGKWDIFVRDRLSGQTTRVSVSSTGEQANWFCLNPAISGDGRLVAFESDAWNLVPGDSVNVPDIFVHDRQTGQTTKVSVSSLGEQANAIAQFCDISDDGRYVAFQSDASNLVPDDTNGFTDVFVHDRQTGQTMRVSLSSAGAQAQARSIYTKISGDGRYVVFQSEASNLVAGDTNGTWDIFVHDRQTAQTTRVSLSSGGVGANGYCFRPSICASGRYVTFFSVATNLVPNDTNGLEDVFIHDRQTGQTERVNVSSTGQQAVGGISFISAASADGRFVAFSSSATNLVPGDSNGVEDVFLRDRLMGQTTRVSVSNSAEQGNGSSSVATISDNGSFVGFHSQASNLVSGDTNGAWDVFVSEQGPACAAADVNCDGVVNVSDLLAVINAWGMCPVPPQTCPADIAPPPNGDGVVNVSDLLMVINNWG